MPTYTQYETVKQQCNAFREIGCTVKLDVETEHGNYGEPRIIITAARKHYHLAEPDWDVIIKQLAQLYRSITC